jgi:hypothetical protein
MTLSEIGNMIEATLIVGALLLALAAYFGNDMD